MRTRLDWHGEKVEAKVTGAAKDGVKKGAEHLLHASQQLVPLDTGKLQQSGKVTITGDGLEATVSYDTVYARRQHEELTWRHDSGRSAKYLEAPMTTEAGIIAAIIAAEIRKAMR